MVVFLDLQTVLAHCPVQMTEWWNSLPFELMFFYGIGILSLMVVIIQLLMTLVGFDSHGGDASFDGAVGDVGHGSGIGLFSTQTLAAFFVAFGWVGVLAAKSDINMVWVSVIASVAGVISMFLMYYMLKGLLRLQAKGNLEYSSVIGQEGTVYVTIPGDDKDGGQVQITIQSRLTTASARKVSSGSLKPGQRVRVVGVNGPTSFVVEEA